MRTRISDLRLLCSMLILLSVAAVFPREAAAHRVNVFAVVEGGEVLVDCFYSKSRRVNAGRVTVLDAATGARLLDGVTDAAGRWAFPVPESARAAGHDLALVLEAGEGHRGEWTVMAAEYAAPASVAPPVPAPPPAVSGGSSSDQSPLITMTQAELTAHVEQAARQAVEQRLAQYRREQAEERRQGPGLTEIVGGLGWFVGLFGLAAWARARKTERGRQATPGV